MESARGANGLDGGAVAVLGRPEHRLRRGRTRLLAIGDLAALAVAYVIAYVVADAIAPLPPVSAATWFLVLVAVTAPLVWLGIFTAYRLYDNDSHRISVSSFDEVRDLFHVLLVGSLGYLIVSQGVAFFFDWWIYTAVEAALLMSGAIVLVPIVRGSIRNWIFPRVMTPRRTLIIGSGADALLVYRKITAHPEYGLDVVGFLDGESEEPLPAPMLGSPGEVARVVDEFDIDRVLLASSVGSHEETLDLVRTVRRPDVHVSIVPRYFEIFTSHATLDDVEGMPVVTLPPMRLGRSARLLEALDRRRRLRDRAAAPGAAAGRCSRSRSGSTARGLRSTGSRGAAASARRSASSSSGRCTSAPSSAAPRCCT